jgi:hypothetical protein
VKNGGNLLSVHCDTSEQVKRAKDILKSSGADDIASTSESGAADAADRRHANDPRYVEEPRSLDPTNPRPLDPTNPRIYR